MQFLLIVLFFLLIILNQIKQMEKKMFISLTFCQFYYSSLQFLLKKKKIWLSQLFFGDDKKNKFFFFKFNCGFCNSKMCVITLLKEFLIVKWNKIVLFNINLSQRSKMHSWIELRIWENFPIKCSKTCMKLTLHIDCRINFLNYFYIIDCMKYNQFINNI